MNPNFETQTHEQIKEEILLDYMISRPAADAEEASDIDIKADILAGNVKHLQWRQTFILRQLFSETAEMSYLILAARNIAGIDWDDGTRAQGIVIFSRAAADVVDHPVLAGVVMLSTSDADGNITRASLLYDAVLKAGQTYTLGVAEIIEIQAESLVQYQIPSSGGGEHIIAVQQIGAGLGGNLPDATFSAFEAGNPTGIETLQSLTPGRSQGKKMTSATLFTLALGVSDQINVDFDGAGAQTITLNAGANMAGVTVATDIQAKLRAIGTGGFTQSLCIYNLTGTDYQFSIFSGTTGASSSVALSAGGNDASIVLGLDQASALGGGSGFMGGLDPQTKESLRAEYETALRSGGESGTAADYVTWAKNSGEAVDDAKITGLTGAVNVFPLSISGVLFSQFQLDAIKTYIETKAPVHLVGSILVNNPTVASIYVSATIVLDTGVNLSNVSAAIKTAVRNLVALVPIGDAGGNAIVRYNGILTTILGVSGVADATNLLTGTVSPPTTTENIVLADGTVAQTDDAKITLV